MKKECGKAFGELRGIFGITEGHAEKFVKAMANKNEQFDSWTNSAVMQKIAARAMAAIDRFMCGKAKRVRFKRVGEKISFEGKSNNTGIRILNIDGIWTCVVHGLRYGIRHEDESFYHAYALAQRCKYGRIVGRWIGGRDRYFVQGIFEGVPYRDQGKIDRHNEALEKREGKSYEGRKAALPERSRELVAFDIGPRNIAVATPLTSFERPLCQGVETKQAEIRRLQRRMERSRRRSNPENYDTIGRIKKGRKKWKFSNVYRKARGKKAEIERKKAAQRKSEHGNLANQILSYGTQVKTEKVSVKGWQKHWGRSIGHHGPSALKGALTRKAANARGWCMEVSTYDTALSQHCVCGEHRKKRLSERIHICAVCGLRAKRDSLSAYLCLFAEYKKMGRDDYRWQVDYAAAQQYLGGHRTLSLIAQDCAESNEVTGERGTIVPLPASALARFRGLEEPSPYPRSLSFGREKRVGGEA